MLHDMTLRGLTLKIKEYYKVIGKKYPTRVQATEHLNFFLETFCRDLFECVELEDSYTSILIEIFIKILIIAELSGIDLDKIMLENFLNKINKHEQI